MSKTIYYDKYRKFAKNIANNNFYILSGRYKFLTVIINIFIRISQKNYQLINQMKFLI